MEREARNVRAKQEQGTERKKMCQSSVLKETENKYDKVTMRNRMHIRHVAWGGVPRTNKTTVTMHNITRYNTINNNIPIPISNTPTQLVIHHRTITNTMTDSITRQTSTIPAVPIPTTPSAGQYDTRHNRPTMHNTTHNTTNTPTRT